MSDRRAPCKLKPASYISPPKHADDTAVRDDRHLLDVLPRELFECLFKGLLRRCHPKRSQISHDARNRRDRPAVGRNGANFCNRDEAEQLPGAYDRERPVVSGQ
jgi:hypothetical protein